MLLSLATASFGPTRRTGSRQQEAAGDCEYGGCRTEEEEARPWHERKEASDRDLLSRSNLEEEASARWIECSGSGRRSSGPRWWVEEKSGEGDPEVDVVGGGGSTGQSP